MHHISCGLHVIHNLGTYAEKKQLMSGQWEKIIEIQDNMHGEASKLLKKLKSPWPTISIARTFKFWRLEGRRGGVTGKPLEWDKS